MNTTKLRRKRVIIPTIATAAILGVGATLWTAGADTNVQGRERDRVGAAAVEAAGGGTAVEVETSDDGGEAYEVEVRKDGAELEVALDQDLNLVRRDADDDGSDDDAPDADDRALTARERASAEKAALDAVGGGTVEDVEAGDDSGTSYEVEVRAGDKTEWDVRVGSDFQVLSKTADD